MNGGGGSVELRASSEVGVPEPLEWKFSQVFGERTAGEEVQEGMFRHFYHMLFLSLGIDVNIGVVTVILLAANYFDTDLYRI